MRFFIQRRHVLIASCLVLWACSSSSSASSSSSSGSSGGGCGGGGLSFSPSGSSSDVGNAPGAGGRGAMPESPAPTGQSWKAEESELGCGRSGLRYVLVDEVCADGEGTDVRSLEVPMFRDGALVGSHLLAVDATHLWSLDVTDPNAIARAALVTGLGQPLAVAAKADRLFVASGRDGLVVVDASFPASPTRTASLSLPGAAFDVDLREGQAFVAMGKHGVAYVDVSGNAPVLSKSHAVPGYAAGVAADDAHVYVAACTGLSILDRTTGAVKGSVGFLKIGDRLVAPAKDVALVGDVAFVAAGRHGAVAVDVSKPDAPRILGECAVDEPGFYASGVRAEGDALFVAGGEWGVLRVDITDPRTACSSPWASLAQPKPVDDCSKEAPWEVVPWDKVWAPPPPGKDPIQVLPSGDRIYAFGDARRIGVRAVDVRTASDLTKIGRYDEPRTLLDIAVHGGKLVASGPRGGVFTIGDDGGLVRADGAASDAARGASAVALLDDGRVVTLSGGEVRVEGRNGSLASGARAISTFGNEIAVVTALDVEAYTGDGVKLMSARLEGNPKLPLSILAGPRTVYYAAPEWVRAYSQPYEVTRSGASTEAPHGVFDAEGIMEIGAWRERVPRRHLAFSGAPGSTHLLELASLGSRAAIAIHPTFAGAAPALVDLPALTYAGLASDGARAFAIAIDRGLYKSYLVTVSLGDAPRVTSIEAFTGAASGIAAEAGRVYVSDADGAIRVYSVTGDTTTPLGVTRVEVKP